MTTYAIITPDSIADPAYQEFEYMLGWFDFNGNWQQKLFTDWENRIKVDNEVFNKEKPGQIGSVTNTDEKKVLLTVEDASFNDVKVYTSIFKAGKVFRIYRDGSYNVVAPDSKTFTYRQRGIRYQIEFEIVEVEDYKTFIESFNGAGSGELPGG